ncbi:MAG: hypothetical protein HKN70_03255 [Gammaproteobacteria bacterium]|nr:hypothetical protein [Gammaproteobacteria bacterium]
MQKPRVLITMLITVATLCLLGACANTPVITSSEKAVAKPATADFTRPNHPQTEACQAPDYHTLDSIVRVATLEVGGGDASGVVIAPNVVLTAAHVLEGNEAGLVYIGQRYKKAVVLGEDPYSDLVLLGVGTENLEPIALSEMSLRISEAVWAVGYPLAQQRTTTQGEFFSYRNGGLLTSAEIKAGSSGGGLLRCENGKFRLAGMVQSYLAYYRHGEPVSYPKRSISVPADAILAFVHIHGIEL